MTHSPPSSFQIAARSLRLLPYLIRTRPGSHFTAADLLEQTVKRRPEAPFVRFEDQIVTYAELNGQANRVAHWALDHGIGRGSVVGLLMENRPEYLAMWMGLAKVGAVIALLNTNQRGESLAHSLRSADCGQVLAGAECLEAWSSMDSSDLDLELYVLSDPSLQEATMPQGANSLDAELAASSTVNPPSSVRSELTSEDPIFYIYTSGTTGLPKAARLSHYRFLNGGTYALLAGLRKDDVYYCPLPLYHTVGGVICVNAVLRTGSTLALARRFSASGFWDDIAVHGATAFQYIGELCRYLLNQPPHPLERQHKLRFALGNGLRPDVWKTFKERFGVSHIVEFYGATESNVTMVNLQGRTGSIGKPAPGSKVALVRFEVAHNDVVRGPDGLCQRCSAGEPGEVLGRISEGHSAAGRYEGYTSSEATQKKILRDVFEQGDAWFRTGDLLQFDDDGYYYFVDRIGDTFRWKGENVSTQEVAEVAMAQPGVDICAVYGVDVPETEGRAGMAALVLEPGASIDGEALFKGFETALPAYARPAFLRFQDAAELTATFKLRKVELQKEGFNPATCSHPVFYRDDASCQYRLLDADAFARIERGEIRF